MKKIIPVEDRVLIKVLKPETVTASGIIIPDTVSKNRPTQGVIEDVGPEVKKRQIGEVVLFSQYGPEAVQMGDDYYYILEEKVILAVIK